MAKLFSSQWRHLNPPVVCILSMLTARLFTGTLAVDPPQTFSVIEEGSIEAPEYSCDSYVKQFNSIEEVRYKQMSQQSDPCECIVRILSTLNVNDDPDVLTVQFNFPVPQDISIKYSWFMECDDSLKFVSTSTTGQTQLTVDCDGNIRVNSVNSVNPTVLKVSSDFIGSVSMDCESQSVITTTELSTNGTTTQGGSANNPNNAPPDNGSPVEDDTSGENGSSGGKTAGIVIGVLLALGVIAAVVVLGIWWWRKKRQQEEPERPGMDYKDPETPAKTMNAYENTGYGNESQNNNMKKGSTSSLNDRPVSYADLDPSSLKRAEYPVRNPSMGTDGPGSPTTNYVELDWKKQSVF